MSIFVDVFCIWLISWNLGAWILMFTRLDEEIWLPRLRALAILFPPYAAVLYFMGCGSFTSGIQERVKAKRAAQWNAFYAKRNWPLPPSRDKIR